MCRRTSIMRKRAKPYCFLEKKTLLRMFFLLLASHGSHFKKIRHLFISACIFMNDIYRILKLYPVIFCILITKLYKNID